jgi:hypothetical protein
MDFAEIYLIGIMYFLPLEIHFPLIPKISLCPLIQKSPTYDATPPLQYPDHKTNPPAQPAETN